MLLWLFVFLELIDPGFAVFQYLTLRGILSVMSALLISLLVGPFLIGFLKRKQIKEDVRQDGPITHRIKQGTPTMGGVLILISITISTLLWSDLSNQYVWVALIVTLGFGLIGWVDDWNKLTRENSIGLSPRMKFLCQSIIGGSAALFLYWYANTSGTCMDGSCIETTLIVPFFKDILIPLGGSYILLAYFVIVGTSNAVNLTDGLDGLAILPTVLVASGLGVFAYLTGNIIFSNYLFIPYVPQTGELVIFLGAIVGSGFGFLWFNTYPAQVFMGDVGALALGAGLGVVAVMVRQELVLFIMGGIFVIETLSVILQVASFRVTGQRIFRMAPIHHHFELMGWPEPRVIVRFWIISVVLVLIGLATLKLR